MIKKLKFRNFYSFGDEVEVSFEVGKRPGASTYDVVGEDGTRINKVAGMIGPNGSGKTQLLKAFPFLSWFVVNSYQGSSPDDLIPFQTHKLKSDENAFFEIEFVLGSTDYKYQLELKKSAVVHESLHVKTSHLYSYLFVREMSGTGYSYKQKGFDFKKNLAEKVRGNASVVSAAYAHDSTEAGKFIRFFDGFTSNINIMGKQHYNDRDLFESALFFNSHKESHAVANSLICELDLGLSAIQLDEVSSVNNAGEEEKVIIPFGVHQKGDTSFRLSFFEESSGTKSTYVLLRKIIPVLESGGVAVLDEIDSDLHFHMMVKLIELFKHKHTNPHDAQLLFSCHSHEILNLFRKHQIILTEKESLYSDAWRLDEMQGLRADDNLYAKYQAGVLGAVPNL